MKVFLLYTPIIILFLILKIINRTDENIPQPIYNKINYQSSSIENIVSCSPSSAKKLFQQGNRSDSLEEILLNDNRQPAGDFRNGMLFINLEARTGIWYPETRDGSGLRVHAFAEIDKPLQLPGPLIRVDEGTIIKGSIRNSIKEYPLVLYGFYSRPGNSKDSVIILPGETFTFQFKAGVAGTYFYRASASNLKDNGLPYFNDSQLSGAFIIDPANVKIDPTERIFMIGIWNDTLNGPTVNGEELVLNGSSWPYTERLTYKTGENVHWRLINASNQSHPMHLHGFFFTIRSNGDIDQDFIYKKEFYRKVVTELLEPGETISMTWVPEKEGNWLFHCHTLVHIMPGSFLRLIPGMHNSHLNNISTHARDGMGGLIMGIHVLQNQKKSSKIKKKISSETKLTLVIGEKRNYFDTLTGKGFMLLQKNITSNSHFSIPGPPIILTRNQPVAIKIINKLNEPTTIHWHGLEIESYFDGVSGWGNKGNQLAPLIQPGDSFIVQMTPPRAGTFIYHTHMHNLQLLDGMYGPLIVLEQGQSFNASLDKILLIGQGDPDFEKKLFLLNGTNKTDTMRLKTGLKYRLRLINITALGPDLTGSLLYNGKPVNWRAIAKDGADLPFQQCLMIPANKQTLSIGETRDFEFKPVNRGNYLFEVRNGSGDITITKVIQAK